MKGFSLTTAALVLWTGAAVASSVVLEGTPPEFRVRDVAGLNAVAPDTFKTVFQVSLDADGVPAMTGSYRVDGDDLAFRPQFPLEPGVTYRAVFKLGEEQVAATF